MKGIDISCLTSICREVLKTSKTKRGRESINTGLCNWKRVANFCFGNQSNDNIIINKFFRSVKRKKDKPV